MGCSGSTKAKPLPADVVDGAKAFFGLADFPLTITATAAGRRLEVHAVGIDRQDMFSAIMTAFAEKHFCVTYASVYAVRGFFKSRFELVEGKVVQNQSEQELATSMRDLSAMAPELTSGLSKASIVMIDEHGELEDFEMFSPITSSPMKRALRRESGSKICLDNSEFKDVTTATREQLREFETLARNSGASMRITLKRDFAPFLRIALLQTIKAADLKVVVAQLTTTKRGYNDVLWLGADGEGEWINDIPNVPEPEADDSPEGQLRVSTEQSADWMSQLVEQLRYAKACRTPTKFYADSRAPQQALSDIEEMTHKISDRPRDEIPKVLQQKEWDLAYRLHAEPEGEQFEGMSKFCGVGASTSHGGTDVIEFATYFTRSSPRSPSKASANLGSLFGKAEQCGEFITQYNPIERRLTIFKVFLNDVLPAGRSAGPRMVAEQPLLRCNQDWLDGRAAVGQLLKIALCDVVNWNTYSLMSKAGEKINDGFEKWIMAEEAKASGLTLRELEASTPKQVFAKTVLGKVVIRTLKLWREMGVADKEIEDVKVEFDETAEFIQGEFRPMMEIVALLRDVPPQASRPPVREALPIEARDLKLRIEAAIEAQKEDLSEVALDASHELSPVKGKAAKSVPINMEGPIEVQATEAMGWACCAP